MSAHEAKGFIKLIQKFVLLNILQGLSFSTHFHPKQTRLVQCYLHIFPPISVVEELRIHGTTDEESIFLYVEHLIAQEST